MKPALGDALAQCLDRLEAGADIEECLRGQGALAAELRPLLEGAQRLRAQRSDIEDHTPQAFQRGRMRMHSARARQAESGGRRLWAGLFGPPAAALAIAAVVAVLVALGFTTDLLRFDADTTSAQVQGVVSRVDPDVIVLTTSDGLVIIRIGENTIVLDAEGNVMRGGDIVPGKSATVEVEQENGDLAGLRIEVEDDDERGYGAEVEFSGLVQTVSGSIITVEASFGVATVHIDSQTAVNGALAPGVTVEVHATSQSDGSYLAHEIEVKGSDGDHGDGDRDGSGFRPVTSGPGDEGNDESSSGGSDNDDGDEKDENSESGSSGDGGSDDGGGDNKTDGDGNDDKKSSDGSGDDHHEDDDDDHDGDPKREAE